LRYVFLWQRVAYVCLLLGGCAAPAQRSPKALALAPTAFDHSEHSGQTPCTGCHGLADPATGRLTRPGSNQHAPCDSCHKKEFFKQPGEFCRVCHTTVEPRAAKASPLLDWPPPGAQRRRSSVFNHAFHLDADKMEQKLGFHVGCRDCHLRKEGQEQAAMAGHVTCSTCHGGQAVRAGVSPPVPAMGDCEKCHVSEKLIVPKGRRMITGDLKFSHVKHERDLGGAAIACAECHRAVKEAIAIDNIMLPAMVDCAHCHEDAKRTGPDKRMANCGTCHDQISAGVAPRDHLGASAPDNHTLRFRTDHADAAKSPEARCRFCHGGMSSTTKDNCFECHVVMKPRDHSLRWSTTDHGPEAAMDRQRCAVCHEADYCSRCHSQRPRSHVPFDAFVNGGHATEARLNLRQCMACHTFEDNCGRCHQGAAFPSGKPK
jgi:hypothetical protein